MMRDALEQDVRLAVRTLRTRPGFAVAAILTLSLGIGATTAVFSVVAGVLLEPFPIHEQDRVLVVWKRLTDRGFESMPFTFESYEGMRDRVRSAELAAHPYHGASRAILDLDGNTTPLHVAGVTGDWFRVLGVTPLAGRLLEPEDDRPGAAPVAVVSPGTAGTLFGDVRDAVGRSVRLNEVTYTIVGVTPRGLEFPQQVEAWVPASALFLASIDNATSLRDASQVGWHMIARVAPGRSAQQTRAELSATLATLPSEAAWLGTQEISVRPFADVITGDVRSALLLLAGAVLLVLLIAGANVANLLLVRGLGRRRELAVRNAIGASRSRILRQLATEATVLFAFSALIATLIAQLALRALLALAPADLPRLGTIAVDARSLLVTGALALCVTIVFGVLPAIRATYAEQNGLLRSRNGDAASGGRTYGLRHALLVAQIAIAVLVLSSAGLLLRSLDRMQRLDLGFAAEGVTLIEVAIPSGRYPVEADHQRAMERLADRVAQSPNVLAATTLTTSPFSGNGGVDAIWYGEGQVPDPASNPYSNYEGADARYFQTMGMPVLRGRALMETDRAGGQPVVVVNQAFARLYWPGTDAVGRRIKLGTPDSDDAWRTIVGVVGDTRYRELTNARPSVYVPYAQGIPVRPRFIAMRAEADATTARAVALQSIDEIEPGATIVSTATLTGLMSAPLARPRFQSALLACFASLGLLLAVVGTYGVMAFFVRQRTREIGIRMALGADSAGIRRLVLQRGLAVGGSGVVLGLAGAIAIGRALQAVLYEVSPRDPLVLALSGAVLLAATAVATILPVRAATRMDPLVVMRHE